MFATYSKTESKNTMEKPTKAKWIVVANKTLHELWPALSAAYNPQNCKRNKNKLDF